MANYGEGRIKLTNTKLNKLKFTTKRITKKNLK